MLSSLTTHVVANSTGMEVSNVVTMALASTSSASWCCWRAKKDHVSVPQTQYPGVGTNWRDYWLQVPCCPSPTTIPRQPHPSASCVPCDYIYKALIPRVQRIKIRVPRLFTEDEVKGKWIVLPPKKYNDFVWNYVGSSSHSSSFTQILGECGKWQYYKIIRPVNYEGECSSSPSLGATPLIFNLGGNHA